ncbi:MAG TPA: hypothetical protein VHE79_04080 [Spirochaetia bacterium]
MNNRLAQFVRGLFFDIQTVEGVQPLEIWIGIRETFDPFEMAALVKNLYKIVIPLVNERCYGRPFSLHSRLAEETVAAAIAWFTEKPDERIFQRFPYPPTGDTDQKELYHLIKARAASILADIDAEGGNEPHLSTPPKDLDEALFPDGLFDFREMRIVDNELPYIIFTDKEYRVIHGLAIVYLWLIDVETIFLKTLKAQGVHDGIIDELRQFARKVQKENPLTIRGKRMDSHDLVALIHEKLKYDDYLDVFENVYAWFEHTRSKLVAADHG